MRCYHLTLACSLQAASRTSVAFPPGTTQQEVRFPFSAAALGTGRLTFSAAVGGGIAAGDALQLDIGVEAQQGEVDIATSFAIR